MEMMESIAKIVSLALSSALLVKAILEIMKIIKENSRRSGKN